MLVLVVGQSACSKSTQPEQPAPAVTPSLVPNDPVKAPAARPKKPLSTNDLSKLVTGSTASIRCNTQVGSGFFVDEEVLVSNAHVVCPGGVPLNVVLPDGRSLLGRQTFRDEWLDIAKVEVLGAHAKPLVVGDSTALEIGEPITFIGSPKGFEFTLHEGKVSFVGRNYLGLAYVQLNATVNPGNSGGPLFNAQGEVVGIVSMKLTSAEGIGLALPIEYAMPPVDGDPGFLRWKQQLDRVATEDRRALEQERLTPNVPKLVSTQVVEGVGVAALIVENWGGPPHGTVHEFVLEKDGQRHCSLKASFTRWTSLKEATTTAPTRQMQWLLRNGFGDGVYVGAGVLEPVDCAPVPMAGVGALSLREGGEEHGTAPIDLEALSRRAPAQPAYAPRASPVPPPSERDDPNEATWRRRFTEARRALDLANQRLASLQKVIDAQNGIGGGGTRRLASADQLKGQLAQQTEARTLAQTQLDDLERQASNAGVPREWRR